MSDIHAAGTSGEPAGNTQSILLEPEEVLPPWTIDQLPEGISDAARSMGWNSLMPVQQNAVPYLAAGRDMIVQSRTGSGKTGAFLIPLLMQINPELNHPQALVLVPTRELAGQVYGELLALGANLRISGALVYGGVGYKGQLDALRGGAQVIVGTPGRVLDHIGRRSLDLSQLNVLIFDEADEMLSMGFYPDMKELRRYIPRTRMTWMFSATMPYKVQMLAEEFMKRPEFLSLSAGKESVDTMEHRWFDAPTMDKDQVLIRLIEMERPDSAIIFCNMKSDVEYVANVLKGRGYNAEMISGDLKQSQRELVMKGIRENRYRFLVATDVAARGIDISDLSHVFLYDIPKDPEMYLHRAGRTARAGNTGVAISLVGDMGEKSSLKKIGRKYGIDFVELPTPTDEQVVERIGERLTISLEDHWRNCSEELQQQITQLDPLVLDLIGTPEGKGEIAMLLSNLYRDATSAAPGKTGTTTTSPSDSLVALMESKSSTSIDEIRQALPGLLQNGLQKLTPGERRRTGRLGVIAEDLAESQEERALIGMLLYRYYAEHGGRNQSRQPERREDRARQSDQRDQTVRSDRRREERSGRERSDERKPGGERSAERESQQPSPEEQTSEGSSRRRRRRRSGRNRRREGERTGGEGGSQQRGQNVSTERNRDETERRGNAGHESDHQKPDALSSDHATESSATGDSSQTQPTDPGSPDVTQSRTSSRKSSATSRSSAATTGSESVKEKSTSTKKAASSTASKKKSTKKGASAESGTTRGAKKSTAKEDAPPEKATEKATAKVPGKVPGKAATKKETTKKAAATKAASKTTKKVKGSRKAASASTSKKGTSGKEAATKKSSRKKSSD